MEGESNPFNEEPPQDLQHGKRHKASGNIIVDRRPPSSLESEQGILGCILLSPKDCILDCVEKIPMGREAFYDLRHQTLYQTLVDMWQELDPIDIITLQQRLKDDHLMEGAGGLAYISSLPDCVPSAANLPYYIDIVLEKYQGRKLVQTCTGIIARIYDHEGDFDQLLNEAERDILAIADSLQQTDLLADLSQIRIKLIDKYERAQTGGNSGIMTGFADLDRITGGMQAQDMIVLMGQPSAGKTTLALNIAVNVALGGIPVGILSLETSVEKILHRIYCSIAEVNGTKFLRGYQLNDWEMKAMLSAVDRVEKNKANLLIDDSGGLSTVKMQAKARRMRQKGAKMLVIDYMQLMQAEGSEYERVTSISRAVKDCAKEGDWPVIAISSLNRQGSNDEGKPKIRHARGSGQLDFDGNQFWLLSCEEPGNPVRTVKLDVAKNKDGDTGTMDLTLFAAHFKFKNAAPEQVAGKPHNDP